MTPDQQAELEQAAREWLISRDRYWIDTFGTKRVDTSELPYLVDLLAAQRAAVLKEAIKIALRNTYMSKECDGGGNHGGPASCEYGCGHVIAQAIRKLAQDRRL